MSRALNLSQSILLALLFAGCVQAPKQLYLWENFPKQQYDALLAEGVGGGNQIAEMEAHAEKARADNAALPPGFRAHLGMLHLSMGNVDQAKTLWLAEKAAFPESTPYMDQLLKRLSTTVVQI